MLPCLKMNYLMCHDSVQILKDAENANKIFNNVSEVQSELIDKMDQAFGSQVFLFKCRTDKKYLKIGCKIPGCPFDIWLKFGLCPN